MTGGCGRRGSWSAMTFTGALCRDEGEGPLLTGLNIVYSFCLRGIGCGDSSRKRVDRRWSSGKGRRQRSQAATASPSHQVRFSFLRHFTAVMFILQVRECRKRCLPSACTACLRKEAPAAPGVRETATASASGEELPW